MLSDQCSVLPIAIEVSTHAQKPFPIDKPCVMDTRWMFTHGMWMPQRMTTFERLLCNAYHVDSFSDWAWTLLFTCKMACECAAME